MRIHEEQIRVPLPAHYDRLLLHIAAHLSENLPADAISSPPERAKPASIARSGILAGLMHDHRTSIALGAGFSPNA